MDLPTLPIKAGDYFTPARGDFCHSGYVPLVIFVRPLEVRDSLPLMKQKLLPAAFWIDPRERTGNFCETFCASDPKPVVAGQRHVQELFQSRFRRRANQADLAERGVVFQKAVPKQDEHMIALMRHQWDRADLARQAGLLIPHFPNRMFNPSAIAIFLQPIRVNGPELAGAIYIDAEVTTAGRRQRGHRISVEQAYRSRGTVSG